jgi:hypothetical protein
MWAVVITVELLDEEKALHALEHQVVPAVKAMDGFVSGTWINHGDGTGSSVALFQTEAQAGAGLPPSGQEGPEGVRFSSARVGKVEAQA